MADNVTLNAGAGGAVIGTDEIAATHFQIVKLAYGDLDSATLVKPSTGLPVAGGAAHDAAVAGDPVLVAIEAKDFDGAALPNTVSAEGDVARLAGSLSGVLYVMPVNEDGSAVSTVLLGAGVAEIGNVKNSGTFAVQESGAALTALQKIDNLAHAGQDVALVEHVPISGQFDDVATVAVTENQVAPVRISSRRALLIEGVASGTVVPVSDGGGALTVDNGGTFAVQATIAAGAAAMAKAEDSASGDLDVGAAMLAVRKATPANTSGTDGDYEFLQMSAGRLWASVTVDTAIPAGTNNIGDVDVLTVPAPLNVVGGGTEATALRVTVASDSTGKIEVVGDVAQDAPIAGNPLSMGGRASSAVPTAMSLDGDSVYAWLDRSGGHIVNGRDAHDAALDANTNPQLIGGRSSAAAPTDVSGDGDAVRAWYLRNGAATVVLTAAGALIGGDAANGLDVDITRIAAGDNNIGNVDIVTMPNVTLAAGTNTNEVVGDVAHDVGVAGNPLLVAGVSIDMDDTAPPNRVNAEADVVRIGTDRDGGIFVHPHGPQLWSYHEDSSSALTDATVHASPGAGLSLYVTDIVFSTGAATACNIFFEEGASKVLGPYYLEAAAGRGLSLHFQTPKKITAATALTVTTSAAIAHGIDVTGFVAAG